LQEPPKHIGQIIKVVCDGFVARGAIEIDLACKDGRATIVELRPRVGGTFKFRGPTGQKIVGIWSGGRKKFDSDVVEISLQERRGYRLAFVSPQTKRQGCLKEESR
jgi:hypothetical protein